MGGCATKPKVSKDDPDGMPKAPQPEPQPELQPNKDTLKTKAPAAQVEQAAAAHNNNLNVNEIVDDDQANKRRSLSFLFKEVRSQIPQSQHFSFSFSIFCFVYLLKKCVFSFYNLVNVVKVSTVNKHDWFFTFFFKFEF